MTATPVSIPRSVATHHLTLEQPATQQLPAVGARSTKMRDQIYWFGTRGLIFTSPWVFTPNTKRATVVLLLTASGRPFEFSIDGRTAFHEAILIPPLTQRGLLAIDVGLISVNVQIHHPAFGTLCRMTQNGPIPLNRRAYGRFDQQLDRAYEGRLDSSRAERLFEQIIETTLELHHERDTPDARAARLHRLLQRQPTCTLEDVARELDVSYSRASHLFTRTVGLPLRSYQHWLKCMRAEEMFGADLRLTEIAQTSGFTDLPHLSRAWQNHYGFSPSYIRDPGHVRIVI